jgi:hypothetical protein
MDKLVARLLAGAALWVRIPDIYQKYKMCDIGKVVATHSSPPKKERKK